MPSQPELVIASSPPLPVSTAAFSFGTSSAETLDSSQEAFGKSMRRGPIGIKTRMTKGVYKGHQVLYGLCVFRGKEDRA
jgi:hypothetical protein